MDCKSLSGLTDYIGVKLVKAKPMTLSEYKRFRGWSLGSDEDGTAEGYVVKYRDSYISWSPAEQFEESNRTTTQMTFGFAIEAMKKGLKAQRKGWNGKGMWLVMMPSLFLPPYDTASTNRKVNDRTAKWIGKDKPLDCQPYIAIYNANEQWQPGWLPSQSDLLAEDWVIV